MLLVSGLYWAFVCLAGLVGYLIPQRFRYIWLLLCSLFFVLYAGGGLPATLLEWLPTSFPATLLAQLPDALLARLPVDLVETLQAVQPAAPPAEGIDIAAALLAGVPALAAVLAAALAGWLCAFFMAGGGPLRRALLLAAALLACLGLLVGCKYLGLYDGMAASLGGRGVRSLTGWVIPLGLSYFTVQSAGYALDVCAGRCEAERNPARYALFVCFFPALFAGPLGRGRQLLPQLARPAAFSYQRVVGGAFRVLWGLFKVFVLAGGIGAFTAAVFADPAGAGGPLLALALLLFAWQLYAGFGGCCDIAIGTARMLGVQLAEGFNRPFAARTFTALWQRWQMPLLGILRDNVFLPLAAAARKAAPQQPADAAAEDTPPATRHTATVRATRADTANTPPAWLAAALLMFLLFALWYLASVQFILWGLYIGLVVCAARLFSNRRQRIAAAVPVYRARHLRGFFQRVFVYLLFAAGLVFFVGGVYGRPFFQWAGQLLTGWGGIFTATTAEALAAAGLTPVVLIVLAAGMLLVELVEKWAVPGGSIAEWIRRRRFFARWPLYLALQAALLLFGLFDTPLLLYLRF